LASESRLPIEIQGGRRDLSIAAPGTVVSAITRASRALVADPWMFIFVVLGGALVYLTVIPLAILLVAGLQDARGAWTLENLVTALTSPSFLRPIQNSLIVALAALSLAWPERSLQDRLAGTWLVPR